MLDYHHRVSETCYEVRGSAPLGVVESFCRDVAIEVQDFISVEPDNDVLGFYHDISGYYCDGG
jgi:hypothetical protein